METRIMGFHRSKLLVPCHFYSPSTDVYSNKLGLSRGHNLQQIYLSKTVLDFAERTESNGRTSKTIWSQYFRLNQIKAKYM